MNVRNCRKCGRIFNYITGLPLCPSCKEVMDEKFQEVKKYIQDNKGATVSQVSQECDVEEAQIRQWVREERLIFAEGSVTGIGCESCGVAITTGRYCDKCKANMISNLSAAGRRPQQPAQQQARPSSSSGSGMRYLK